jgi:hypothetical protein
MTQFLQRLYDRLGWTEKLSGPQPLAALRREAVRVELEENGGKKFVAAMALGISPNRVTRILKGKEIVVGLLLCLGMSVVQAQVKGSALLIPAIAPTSLATNKTQYLTWTSSEARFAVYTGTNRVSLGNRQVISENKTRLTNGVHYGIAAINVGNIESTLAYWPSNRIAEIWLRGYGANLNQFTNVTRLVGPFTNAPPGQMQFWGVADITIGWQ